MALVSYCNCLRTIDSVMSSIFYMTEVLLALDADRFLLEKFCLMGFSDFKWYPSGCSMGAVDDRLWSMMVPIFEWGWVFIGISLLK